MNKTSDAWEKWVLKNPLRAWRITASKSKRTPITQARIAGWLRCTPQIVRLWETGLSTPNKNNFPKIAKIIGTKEEKLRTAWKQWAAKQPA